MFSRLAAAVLIFSFSTFAHADRNRDFRRGHPRGGWGNDRSERIRNLPIGQTVYGGNGCPQGTMQALFAPDYLSFTLLFDQFVAETGTADNQRRRDVMNCDTSISLQIPEGMQMEISRVDFRGFVGLPERSRAVLNSVFSFGRGERMNMRFNFEGPVMDNYEISSDTLNAGGNRTPENGLSPCGGPAVLRIMNSLKVTSPAKGQQASLTIDSIDGSSNAVYYVNWKACTAGGRKGPGGRG